MDFKIQTIEGDGKRYRRQPALPPVTDADVINNELAIIRDGKVRVCRYLGKLVYLDEKHLVSQDDIKRFVQLYDHCVKYGRLAYGQLAPIMMLPLALIPDSSPRAMLLVYAFSDYSVDDLNKWLGIRCFDEEGAMPSDQWPNLKRRWNDPGFRKRIWEQIFEGAAVSDEVIEEMARIVMDMIPGFYSSSGSTEADEVEAIELAAKIAAIARRV